jgi:hypothetical protein
MSSEEEKKTITLRSNDGKEFRISEEEARVSSFIVDTLNLDDEDNDNDDDEEEALAAPVRVVDVLRVSGSCLEHVVEFMVHYAKNAMLEINLPMTEDSFNGVRGGCCLGIHLLMGAVFVLC